MTAAFRFVQIDANQVNPMLLERYLQMLDRDQLVEYLKPIFPSYEGLPGIVEKRFWPFETSGYIGYRVPHPKCHTRELRSKLFLAVKQSLDNMAAETTAGKGRAE